MRLLEAWQGVVVVCATLTCKPVDTHTHTHTRTCGSPINVTTSGSHHPPKTASTFVRSQALACPRPHPSLRISRVGSC
jgi:hypothetical protein